jgi:hypothetical protein
LNLQPPFGNHGNARGIIAAIFQAFETLEQKRDERFRADVSYNAAHENSSDEVKPI